MIADIFGSSDEDEEFEVSSKIWLIQQISVLLCLVLNIGSSFLLLYVSFYYCMFLFITVCLLYIIINKTCLWKPAHVHILWIKEDLNGYVVNTNICTIFKGFEEADVEAAKKKKEKKKGSMWKFVFIHIEWISIKSILCNVLCWFKNECICVNIQYLYWHMYLCKV